MGDEAADGGLIALLIGIAASPPQGERTQQGSGFRQPEVRSGCMRDGSTGPAPQSPSGGAGVVLRRTAQRRARALAGERTLEAARGRCHLSRPAASHTTMPPMTGPEHYQRAEQLLAEASQIIRFRQEPGQSGPADLPARPTDMEERRRLSSDPGLPDRTIAEAQVHATLALAAATAVAGLGPDSRAWADVAGTKLSSG